MNDSFVDEYDRELVNKKLMRSLKSEGYRNGIEKGKKEKQIEIAKKMLEKNSDIKFICECTGLIEEDLENLK